MIGQQTNFQGQTVGQEVAFSKPYLLLAAPPLRNTQSSFSTTVFVDEYLSDGRVSNVVSELTEPELISLYSESDNDDNDNNDDNKSNDNMDDGGSSIQSNNNISNNNSNSNNSSSNLEKELLDALPAIAAKFDALFPFYRLSDKDCKKLSLLVFNEINKIHKIFCNAHGRSLQVIIYYYNNPQKPKNIFFYNNDDNEKEVESWNDIKMDEKYQKLELLKQLKKENTV